MTASTLYTPRVDAHPLDIKKLRGEEPVETIDLSCKGLTDLSVIIIANLIPTNTATKSLKYGVPMNSPPYCQR